MSGKLEGQVGIVTGGGTGVGRAIARLFAAEGAKVIITGRRTELLAETANLISLNGGIVSYLAADVSVWSDAKRVVNHARLQFGALHILVNNAAVFESGSVVETDEAVWDRVIAINLKSVFLMSKAAIPLMRETGGGNIINLISNLALVGVQNTAAYCAAAGGRLALTRAMALDHAPENIRVNALCPGALSTLMQGVNMSPAELRERNFQLGREHPLGRLGTPEEIASAALFLASSDSSWMTGSVLVIDGGYTAI